MSEPKEMTHTAFALKREGRRHMRHIEVGTGRLDADGVFHGFLDRLPIGGFNGYIHFAPIGAKPPEVEPERPGPSAVDQD
jgi:hypothetical protein